MNDASNAKEFIDFMAAAMLDAAVEGKCSQMQTTVTPPGGSARIVRIIVVPEAMDFVRSKGGATFQRPA